MLFQKTLEGKRDKLETQLEEAKELKRNIDRRSDAVSTMLYKYLTAEEYSDYDHFINMKAKLLIDSREIADKIQLGEEQLAALRETLNEPRWGWQQRINYVASHPPSHLTVASTLPCKCISFLSIWKTVHSIFSKMY